MDDRIQGVERGDIIQHDERKESARKLDSDSFITLALDLVLRPSFLLTLDVAVPGIPSVFSPQFKEETTHFVF